MLAHEMAHIQNGDMVTMTLVQGVVNAFVLFLARVAGSVVRNASDERNGYFLSFVVTMVLQVVLGILGMMIVAWFSRAREFRADAGGATLAGRQNMIAALQALGRGQEAPLPEKMAAFGISGSRGDGFKRLFMSHPPLEERIAALRAAQPR